MDILTFENPLEPAVALAVTHALPNVPSSSVSSSDNSGDDSKNGAETAQNLRPKHGIRPDQEGHLRPRTRLRGAGQGRLQGAAEMSQCRTIMYRRPLILNS